VYDQIHKLNAQAWQLFHKNVPRAIELSQQAEQMSQTAGAYGSSYSPGLAESWYQLGRFNLQIAQFDEALSFLGQARQLYELLDEGENYALVLNFMGTTYAHLGDYAEGMQNLLKGLSEARRIGSRSLEATSLADIGNSLNQIGDYAQALPNLEQGLAIFIELNDPEGQAMTLESLALAYLGLTQYDQALSRALESVTLCQQLGARRREATHLGTVGRIYAAKGQSVEAQQTLTTALDLARKFGYRLEEQVALQHLGSLHSQLGDLAQAQPDLEKALAIAVEINARRNQYECHELLAALYRQQHNFEKALQHYEQFHVLKETVYNEQNDMRLHSLEIQHRLDTTQKAAESYQQRAVTLEREIDERKKTEAVLQELATTDPLTGLSNRRTVLEQANKALGVSQRYKHPLTVIMLDIDRFKSINDTYGHAAGDQVIIEFAQRIRSKLRTSDILGRYGGDEFLIILPNSDLTGAEPVVRRIQAAITGYRVVLKEAEIQISTSIGLSSNEIDYSLTLEALIEKADAAMYTAKVGGRDQIQVSSP
jgi:diguanylate cyclase (GGDEF)-like protein